MATNVGNPAQSCPLKQSDYLPDQAQKPDKHFVNFKLVDDNGSPLQNVQVLVTLPDGSSQEMTSDEKGMIEIPNIDPGSCKIDFDFEDTNIDNVVFLS